MININKNSNLKFNKEDFSLLRDYIYEQTGIYFSDSKFYFLNNRLNRRLLDTNCSTFKDYYYFLKYDNTGNEYINLVNAITTNETSFFRNAAHIDVFKNHVIPSVLKLKQETRDRKIRIWNAGCSTGEEPYTLAIMLLESGLNKSFQIDIIANDICDSVLKIAREGIYNRISLRNTSPALVSKYFNRLNNSEYQVKDELKRVVKFMSGNLNQPNTLLLVKERDIIFCRNVLIYFGVEARKRVIQMFYNKMVKNGYLFIGHSETLHGISTAFKIVHKEKTIYYQKPN